MCSPCRSFLTGGNAALRTGPRGPANGAQGRLRTGGTAALLTGPTGPANAALAHPLQLPQPADLRDAVVNGGDKMRNLGITLAALLLLACSGTGKKKVGDDVPGNQDVQAEETFENDVLDDLAAEDGLADDLVPDDLVGPQDTSPTDAGELPENCCLVDDDCDPGNLCIGYEGGPWPDAGTCQLIPEEGRCWSDADCPFPADYCEQAAICGCGEKCMMEPGWCLHVIDPPNCCETDEECGFDLVCIGAEMGAGGTCLAEPALEDCYYNSDCGTGEYCIAQSVCSCDMNCISETGFCIPYDVNCCFDDDECGDGEQCIGASLSPWTEPGVCKSQAPNGLCWQDAHCKPGQECQGASICPCDADCDGADMPGKCVEGCDDIDCCCSDGECGQGSVCVYLDDGNICLAEQPEGMCWQDSDCAEHEHCFGGSPCGCNSDCDGDGWDMPGECKPTGGDMCCMTDADCPQFFVGEPMFCLLEDGNPFVAGTCQPMAPFGKCWSEEDCYMVQTCQGNGFCPCGMDCQAPGTTMGDCSPLPASCCYTDADCDDGNVCRGDSASENMPGSCVPDPNGPQCLGDAQCCWDNLDCDGGTCSGASVCGCIELCPVCGACQADQMGWCE